MRTWFRIENSTSDPTSVDVHIIDVIGGWDDDWIERNWGYDMGVTARKFVEQLAQLSDGVKTINVRINSPGGDIQAGINIANALREQQVSKGRAVITHIDGIAASIASVIAMAGSEVRMADNALVMVHNPWGLMIGNAGEMRKFADALDTMRGQIVNTYKWHSKLEAKDLEALMDAETWMNADEAIANGLATHKIEGLKAAACLDGRGMARLTVPEKYRDQVKAFMKPEQSKAPEAPQAAAASDINRVCAEAGLDLAFARSLEAANLTLEQVNARVTSEKAARAAAKSRETAIRTLCKNAHCDRVADTLVKSALSIDDVKAHLTTLVAMKADATIDPSLDPDHGGPKKSVINLTDIYHQENKTA